MTSAIVSPLAVRNRPVSQWLSTRSTTGTGASPSGRSMMLRLRLLLRRDGGEVVECARARRRRLARQVFVAVAHARARLGAQSRVACDALAPLLAACRRIAPPLRDRDRPFHHRLAPYCS